MTGTDNRDSLRKVLLMGKCVVESSDNIDQNLLMRVVKKHAKDQWDILYVERWLKAPMQEEDGRLVSHILR